MTQLMRRRERIDKDIEGVDAMDIREIVVQGIVDGVGCDQIVIAGRVVAALEPANSAVERIEDDLLHFGLGVHLLQGRIGYTL